MKIAALGIILAGWAIAMSGLFITKSNAVQTVLACVGIGVSLVGSVGVLNAAHQANAIWKQ
jgi:hypothetical protein